jgi:Na+:H+ antiporter, NhaA family
MHDERLAHAPTRLPGELIDWLSRPFQRFMRIEAGAGAMLLLATIAALVLSNSPLAQPFDRLWATPMGVQMGPSNWSARSKAGSMMR